MSFAVPAPVSAAARARTASLAAVKSKITQLTTSNPGLDEINIYSDACGHVYEMMTVPVDAYTGVSGELFDLCVLRYEIEREQEEACDAYVEPLQLGPPIPCSQCQSQLSPVRFE